MPRAALPPHLQDAKHWDWPWPFSLIPRRWTAFKWGLPIMVAGTQAKAVIDDSRTDFQWTPKPIPEPGTWQLSRFPGGPWFAWYFGFTLPGGRHFRIGARWDDVDDYVQFPAFATRRLPPDRTDTSTT